MVSLFPTQVSSRDPLPVSTPISKIVIGLVAEMTSVSFPKPL